MASNDKISSYVIAGKSKSSELGEKATAEGNKTTAFGKASHAEGGNYDTAGTESSDITVDSSDIMQLGDEVIIIQGPVAYGDNSHAEGCQTLAYGYCSHAEGDKTKAVKSYSHAEGAETIAYGEYSHAEGYVTSSSGDWSHSEGELTSASGASSHAEGGSTLASGENSHAEGQGTNANGACSHAEGYYTEASENYSHAEGSETKAIAMYSHAEGAETTASEQYSHAEGKNTIASGLISHAEGYYTEAFGGSSHAEGQRTNASGGCSHAEGQGTDAKGKCSHAEGSYTIANNYQHAGGRYNASTAGPTSDTSTGGSLFVIGKGTALSARSNAFRIATTGAVYGAGAYSSSGADFAEYFEWKDKNIDNEDRVGLFVTLDGEYIRLANSNDEYILGVISAVPSIIGNSYFGDNWHNMYKTDIFGRLLTEIVYVEEYTDEETKKVVPEHDEERAILNPEWNSELEYISREERKEWDAVGMLGQLVCIDDGTCEVNGYCKVSNNGIATKSNVGYRVISRLDDTHIKIIFR